MSKNIKKPNLSALPSHTKELANITKLSTKIIDKFNEDRTLAPLTPKKKKTYKYIFETYLYAVADLSLEVNAIREDLQRYYDVTYRESPALGNKLYYEEYFNLHTKYDKVKKMIWTAIFKVDGNRLVQPDILI